MSAFGTETQTPISTSKIIDATEIRGIKFYFTSVLKETEVIFLTNITSISVTAEAMKGVFSFLLDEYSLEKNVYST